MTKFQRLPDSTTLGEVRAYLREKFDEGCLCSACGQRVQRYSRPITSAMAYGLIIIYRHHKTNFHPWQTNTFIHLEDVLKESKCPSSIRGDLPKLKHWGLIEANETNEGFYKITQKGIDFVMGLIKVESNVLLFNNRFIGFKGEYKSIRDCLKKKFDYDKLMKGEL